MLKAPLIRSASDFISPASTIRLPFTFAAGRGGLKVLITSGDAAAHPDPSRGVRVGGDPT